MTNTLETTLNAVYTKLDAADLYYGHGSDNAWDEAVYLVLSACDLPLDAGDEVLQQALTPRQQAKVDAYLQARLVERKPLPYITNEAWFCGLPFYVDERVLIPRSPFAEWIQAGFEPWCQTDKLRHILEIGTGSGCIAIAMALALPNAEVDASDISAQALAVAEKNRAAHGLQDRVHLHQSDVFASLPVKAYDLIVSNPPYVASEEMQDVPDEYRHEPASALEAPDEGMAIVARILDAAPVYLADEGVLMVEVGYSQDIFERHFPKLEVIWLEQQQGGAGIFVIDKASLLRCKQKI